MSALKSNLGCELLLMETERRQHRRLAIRLAMECRGLGWSQEMPIRTVTTNISTGGVFFEMELPNGGERPKPNELLNIALTVPPGDGHFPYQGLLTSVAEVLRCNQVPSTNGEHDDGPGRVGIAAQFRDALKLAF
jgi:hypothetical protein